MKKLTGLFIGKIHPFNGQQRFQAENSFPRPSWRINFASSTTSKTMKATKYITDNNIMKSQIAGKLFEHCTFLIQLEHIFIRKPERKRSRIFLNM